MTTGSTATHGGALAGAVGRRPAAWSALRRTPTLCALIALFILSVLVVLPLIVMALASLRPAGVLPLEEGDLVLSGYLQVFGQPGTVLMLRNTAVYALGS